MKPSFRYMNIEKENLGWVSWP